jgi:hypothetical protein
MIIVPGFTAAPMFADAWSKTVSVASTVSPEPGKLAAAAKRRVWSPTLLELPATVLAEDAFFACEPPLAPLAGQQIRAARTAIIQPIHLLFPLFCSSSPLSFQVRRGDPQDRQRTQRARARARNSTVAAYACRRLDNKTSRTLGRR